MTVDTLQKYLKSLELDYQHTVKETDEKLQCLKREKHDVHKRWYSAKKASEVDKLEISNLKKNNLFLKSNHQCKIDDLQEEIEFQKKDIESHKKEFHEMENELQKMNNDYKKPQSKYEELAIKKKRTDAWQNALLATQMKNSEIVRARKEKEEQNRQKSRHKKGQRDR